MALIADRLDVLRNLGFLPAAHFALQRLRERISLPDVFDLKSKHARHPLRCRRGSSDLDVFGQIFTHREYRCLDHVRDARLIIDCGANVGFSAAYFLSRFPQADLIAVECDRDNFRQLSTNLEPYGLRARPVLAGVWWRTAGLVVENSAYAGDGREWAFGVREAAENERSHVTGVSIGDLLTGSRHERIDILKIDIEGGEEDIFARSCPWLALVDNLVIETHGPQCEANVRAACTAAGFDVERFNAELIVCRRPTMS